MLCEVVAFGPFKLLQRTGEKYPETRMSGDEKQKITDKCQQGAQQRCRDLQKWEATQNSGQVKKKGTVEVPGLTSKL